MNIIKSKIRPFLIRYFIFYLTREEKLNEASLSIPFISLSRRRLILNKRGEKEDE